MNKCDVSSCFVVNFFPDNKTKKMLKLWLFFVVLLLQLGILLLFQNRLSNILSSSNSKQNPKFCDSLTNISISEVILKQPKCDSQRYEFVVLIHSAIQNKQNRDILRKQLKNFIKFKPVFILGNGNIEEESGFNDDILQGNFVDSYRNLTRKHVFGLSWAVNCFQDSKWILKIDDDIYVNFHMIQEHFERLKAKQTLKKHYILGYVHDKMAVIRQRSSKWFVEKTEFTSDFYPEFASGWAYLTRIESAKILLNKIKNINKSFWIDDVFITGIVREQSCVQLFALNHLFNVDVPRLMQWLKGQKMTFAVFFSNTNGDLKLMEEAFEKINRRI